MTRKDNEKDAERPHYYSQFWLDVAAGRRIIGLPKNEEGDGLEAEASESVTPRRAARASAPTIEDEQEEQDEEYTPEDGVSPLDKTTDVPEAEANEIDIDNVNDLDLVVDDVDVELPEEDVESEEEDLADEDFFDEEEEEEEEDEESWGARGRKKAKPVKKPVVKKPGKRDPRRGF